MKKEDKKELIIYLTIIITIILIRAFIITPVRVSGQSMYPTLKNGEIMILNKINYRFNDIKRGDIVVIKTDSGKIIKRVIGLPNETLKYEDNILYIDGVEVKEPYLKEKTEDFDLSEIKAKKIPSNYYFVIGDNRDNSKDSRIIGFINKKDIKGSASLVLYPFNKIGNRN